MDNETLAILERVHKALIRYPRFKELHRDIRECQEITRLASEPQCMSLEGVTGAGKSTLIQDYAALFPRIEEEDGTRIPVFYLETPSPVTVKGMASTMLSHLGDPAANRGTLWSMNSRLIKLMIACQVELTILDDFHHLIDKKTNRILEQVSDWLKVLIKESGGVDQRKRRDVPAGSR
ncbi:MAG: TniB family NTP-binding protein [Anaerolineae bacterium]